MRTYKLYFSNGKSTLIKAKDRETAWIAADWHLDYFFDKWGTTDNFRVLYIQFYHT